ncbi:tetratricopeptide repeat-containing sensor histidine kinase [Ferruginibacter sp.]
MKKILILFYLLCSGIFAKSQNTQEQVIRARLDSIISLIVKENNEENKVDLVLSIYTISIDGYPVLLLEAYKKLYSLSQEKKDIILESSAWSLAGQAYRLSGSYVKALECHYKAIGLAEKSGNMRLLSYARNQNAHIYKDRQENEKALELYRQASLYDNKTTDRFHHSWWAYMNIGAVYLNMGMLDSSLFYSLKAQSLLPPHSSETSYTYILANIGSVYSQQGNLVKAREYFSNALQKAEEFQSERFISNVCLAMAEHFNRIHQVDSSIYFAKRAVTLVQGSMIANLALKPAKLLAGIYENSNADSALKYWKVYMAANDSLNSIRTSQQMMVMAFDEDQRKLNIEREQASYRNTVRTNLLITGLGLFCIVALILYRNNKQKQKANVQLEKTLTELKATQQQLVHAEKMASLGELTAGIAHEIQNPLNFVNNFSEVSNELIDEMNTELNKGDIEEAKAIGNDIRQNLEKINHHGKRADAIVKGMLQHSRTSSGQKESTDINALCDEYLRLSYHGLRAKDKSFNATLKTDFDPSLGKINIIPQDMGRVIMNLLTNAFYAVAEKKKLLADSQQLSADYEPTVSISTKKQLNKVVITVTDNGNGVPKNIIDKIFQPFFTTKPTGQGTGLGLSLAYDIIKAHSGELQLETKEKEGTTFIIQLPIV